MLTPIFSTMERLRSRLRRLFRTLFPRAWVLQANLRDIDRYYRPLVAQAKGDEREMLIDRHIQERTYVEEELDGIQTQRLLRQASRYYIVVPGIPRDSEDHQDDNWTYGWLSGTWYLEPAAIASLRRQIEEVQKRRREAWDAWAKILGSLITGLVALVSALVSLILAWGR